MHTIKTFIIAHKIITTIGIAAVLGGGYWEYKNLTNTSNETRYVLGQVQKGTLVTSITGTGQVSVSNQIDLKLKVSGDIVSIGVVSGQEVKAGTLITQLDARDAQKAVRDAQVSLDSAKISLEKLKQPADALSIIQTENALSQAQADLPKSYDSGFNSVSNAFIDLPTVMTGLQDVLYGTTVSKGQDNISAYADLVKTYDETVLKFKDDAAAKYQTARTSYDQNTKDYKAVTRFSGTDILEHMIDETYGTTKNIADAVKSANDLLSFVKDRLTERNPAFPAILTTHQNSLASYTNLINTRMSDLSSVRNTITSSKQTIAEKTEALTKLEAGADPLDIKSQELSVKQRENALLDTQTTLANYFIRAPFDGTVAKLNINKYDSISPSTVIATLITHQKIAQISLNEVDAAQIKVGEKATITFDAVPSLSITGEIAEIDTVGTVTQGVVTYSIKINFDTQDTRVKSGMSVSAAIITNVKQDVLLIPNSAVKNQGNMQYVEMFDALQQGVNTQSNQGFPSATPPRQYPVTTGLSNDAQTEITSGLTEGDHVVTRTISAQTTTTTSAPSILPGGNRGGGGLGGGRFGG